MFTSKFSSNTEDRAYLGKEEYTILNSSTSPLIKYKNVKFAIKSDLFIYKNQHFVQDNMRWIEIQTFKLFYEKSTIQCLYIQNTNCKNKSEIILFSQCFYTNFASILPFLIDLSNFLRINIITYEYTNKKKQKIVYEDINYIYQYLFRIKFIKKIILLGLSVGNKVNMSILTNKQTSKMLKKIGGYIFLSPTWVYDHNLVHDLKNMYDIKDDVNDFIDRVNLLNIPIFVIHGMLDNVVRYFLSISFMQKINNKLEWYPKKASHFDIVDLYRTKILDKIKKFINDNILINSNEENYLLDNIDLENMPNVEERETAAFFENNNDNNNNNLENKKTFLDRNVTLCGNFNNNDRQSFAVNLNNNNNEINQNLNVMEEVKMKNDIITCYNSGEIGDEINENNIDFENFHGRDRDNSMISNVSFLPGDVIPNFKNKDNHERSLIYRKPTNSDNRMSCVSFIGNNNIE